MILCDRCVKHPKRYAADQPTLWNLIVEAHRNGAPSALLIVRTVEAAAQRVSSRLRRAVLAAVGTLKAFLQEIGHYWTRCAVSFRERLWGGQ